MPLLGSPAPQLIRDRCPASAPLRSLARLQQWRAQTPASAPARCSSSMRSPSATIASDHGPPSSKHPRASPPPNCILCHDPHLSYGGAKFFREKSHNEKPV